MNFFATTPKGLELLLVDELRQLGAENVSEKLAGVVFSGDIRTAYKACLWTRLANRILLPLVELPVTTPEQLYAAVQTIAWDEHLEPEGTLNVNFVSSQSEITHTLFGAQKVKDAIVDQFRDKLGVRPSVSKENADLCIYVYLYRNRATIGIDLSGESLHRRSYRLEQRVAPLKENLAAAILMRAGWPKIAAAGGTLIDPMCGSGTLLIEAALMAGNIAPGLLRDYFGFLGWKQHTPTIWAELISEANGIQDLSLIPPIIGYDVDPEAVRIAIANAQRAGLSQNIHVEEQKISSFTKTTDSTGLIVVNPPYGERIGEIEELNILYSQFGAQLKKEFASWKVAVFTGNPDLGKSIGIRARKKYPLFNGTIPCQLLLFDMEPEWYIDRSPGALNERRIRNAQRNITEAQRETAQMFVNRLQKKHKHLKRWAQRENIHCYRLYDADLPEFGVSIDIYDEYLLVKAYPAPKSVKSEKVTERLQSILAVLPEAIEIPSANIFFKESLSDTSNSDLPVFEQRLHIPPG